MIRPPKPSEVLSRYPTDKVGGAANGKHSYGGWYDSILPRFRWCEAVLECGILDGASLRAWAEYFPDADIYAADIDKSRLINEGRIQSHFVDCSSADSLRYFACDKIGLFAVIVDDASHQIEDQLLAFEYLRKCLKWGGVMVIEDVSSPENADRLRAVGMRIEEFDVANRHDDRLGWYVNA